jgi:HemY protein
MQAAGLSLDHAVSLRTLSHVLAAESAHALQDKALRQHHLAQAVMQAQAGTTAERQTLTEGVQLRAARWLLDDRDAQGSLERLKELPTAVGRRMVAMRLLLKASRLAGQTAQALDTAVLLAKHRAFSPAAAESLVRGLILEWLTQVRDADGVQKLWQKLNPSQRKMPEVAAEVALRFMALGGSPATARLWLESMWDPLQAGAADWSPLQMLRVVRALELSQADPQAADARQGLARVEGLQLAQPRDPRLQYLAGMVCLRHRLWGKAQALLTQAAKGLQEPEFQRRTWLALAELAEHREDAAAAAQAWKQAALVGA